MAKVGACYPQVDARVTQLMDARVTAIPTGRPAADALRAAGRARAEIVVVAGARRAIRRQELERVVAWGLGRLDTDAVAWDDVPVVNADASEIVARRLVAEGARMLLVRRDRDVVGVVDAGTVDVARPSESAAHRLERL